MKLYLDTANPALWVRSEGAPRVSEVADTVLDLSAKLGPQPAADGTTG